MEEKKIIVEDIHTQNKTLYIPHFFSDIGENNKMSI